MGFSKRSSRRVAWMAVALMGLLTAAPATALAQQDAPQDDAGLQATEPVVVVTLGSIDKLTQDINYLTSAIGQPQAGGMFNMMAMTFTQGVDTTRPIGVLVPLVNGAPQPIAMVPTSDVKTVLKRLEAQTGPADELDDGTLVVAVGASTIYIRQSGAWAVLAPNRELLSLAPADPTTIFEGMGNDYDVAMRLKMQQVPAQLRDMMVMQMRQGFNQAMEQRSGGDADAARSMAESTIDQLELVINETDEVSFGINIDQTAKQVAVNGSFTAVPGSQLAALYGTQKPIPSQFATVIRPDAAGYYHAATSISPEAVELARGNLDNSLAAIRKAMQNNKLSEEQQAELEAMINRIVELALDSMAEGRADLGALLLADQNEFRFVFGSFVSDGNEAAQIVKDLAAKVENQPNAPRFKFDVDTYKDVNLHVVEADVPEAEAEARKVFGETLRVHVGTGPKAVYAAVGQDSLALMKELIDSGTEDPNPSRPVGQLRIKLMPILQYAQSIEANDTLAAMIDSLSRAPDQGEINLIQKSIQNGQETDFTIGEGVLQAIGAASRQAQQNRADQF